MRLVLSIALVATAACAQSPDFFELKIRPVLATNCYPCHAESALGGLRLDSRAAMLKGGKRGASIIAGDPEKSPLILAVRQTDENLKMPQGGKLKDSEIADLVSWVKAGAVWPAAAAPLTTNAKPGSKYTIAPERRAFWSLQPLKDTPPPAVKDAKWARSPVDQFILARLEKEGMKPVHPASKHDLLRRATLDLTGLPPTPEEIAAFDKDTSPNAFAKVVDRLLASPHYGERWGRAWLDVARYGEDDYRSLNPFPRGYFPYANAYLYRDWVIQAFNDDLPYDKFVKAQLAGDLLDEKVKVLPATGFLGLGPWYFDNGSVEVTRADERHDRVDVVSRGFLGLTVACARCHDHKYDPIPQTDYYALAGVFKNTAYHEYPLAPKAVVEEHLGIEAEVEKKQRILQETQAKLAAELSESLAFQTSNYLEGVYDVVALKKEKDTVVESRKLDYELLDRWIAYMAKVTTKYHEKDAWQAMMKRAEKSPPAKDDSGGRGGRGGARTNPEVKKLAEEFQAAVVKSMLTRKDLNEENDIITAKSLEGTTKKKRANKPNEFITNDDFCPGCGLRLKNMPEDAASFWTEIFQKELKDSDDPTLMNAIGGRDAKPGVLLFRGWGLETRVGPEAQARMASIKADVDAAKKKLDPSYPFVHGVQDVAEPSDLELALRGNPMTLGDKVPRHFLSILSKDEPKKFEHGSGRLELAEEILKQPIAMRVIVNRIWKGHFGTGIVDTPSNFGIGGERPTNPELLDYLAQQFIKDGLSIKKLHRTIMMTATYQLSADNDAVNYAKDAGDRLYWRVERKRMDAEQIRDAVLMVAGNLDTAMGGPSQELTPAFKGRTVYGKVSRYKLDEYLQLFDFPSPNISAEKRFTTTVPLQRLFLMNSDFMQIEAEELAKRVAGEPDNRSRIKKVYTLAYGRDPSEEEIKLGLDYLHAEPLREYDEEKIKPEENGGGRGGKPAFTGAAKPEMPAADVTAEAPAPEMGMGMLGGMGGRGGRSGAAPEVKYEPTAWGRYIKVLLSSSEFVFIN